MLEMKYIKDYKDGDRVFDVYFCKFKSSAVTKNGKNYDNVIIQDKTGTLDAKIWDPNNAGIADFEAMDYIEVYGDITSFNGALQLNIKRVRKCEQGEYDEKEYMPISKHDLDKMYSELVTYIDSVKNPYLNKLLNNIFVNDTVFSKRFKNASAAKSVHHGFIGGLLEHTLGVVKLCDYYCSAYPRLNRDLLITAAICHDMGKTKEISAFPLNDYTDDGQFLGHIVIGSEMIGEKVHEIDGFPPMLEMELKHCILSHHGEYEYGSPKKPAIIEAVALNFADNTDAKLETFTEILEATNEKGWIGYNKLFESNLRETQV
jgi:3'-5' exoribonuclease